METVDHLWRRFRHGYFLWQRRRQRMMSNGSPAIDVKTLEDRTLYSVTPITLDALEVQLSEDAANTSLDLTQYFSADDGNQRANYSLVDESGDALFDRTPLTSDGRLVLDLARDAFGNAELLIEASNRIGDTEWLPVEVRVLPLNDTPTTTGIVNVRDMAGTGRTVVDLFAAFDDVEDGSSGLTYSIGENSNPALFDSVTISQQSGRLILDYADNATGVSKLSIIATDSGGLSVGMAPQSGFAVYNEIHGRGGTSPDSASLGLQKHDLWTGGRFFPGTTGNYRYDLVDFDKYDRFLTRADASIPNTYDLEDPLFDNSPAGRDRFARLLSHAKSERPDLDIGVYRILPERQWFDPVQLHRAQLEESQGLSTWYTARETRFEMEYDDWQARNALYRTENVSGQFGGQTVADLVDIVNPSLYTLYRDTKVAPVWRRATLNPVANTITVDGPSFEFADTVRLEYAVDATLNNGLSQSEEYFVVNAEDSTFQIALTPGGAPINFDGNFSGRIYAGATDFSYVWHDPSVVYWETYAEENIAEAREYGKRVHVWLKPTMHRDASASLDYDFFRWQLEVVRPLVDGIVIYEDPVFDGAHQIQQEWWRALEDFMSTLNGPHASFRVNVLASQGPADPDAVGTPVDDTLTAREDTPATWDLDRLFANDVGVSSQHTIRFSQPMHGTLEQLADGSLRYTPEAHFDGVDEFRYRVTDGRSESAPATVAIRVSSQNDAPLARNDRVDSTEDQVLVIDVNDLLANDVDVDGDSLNFRIVTGPAHGTLVQDDDGTLRYRPDDNFSGTDRFQYRVNDGHTGSNAATVMIEVAPVNDLPDAVPDVVRTDEDTPLTLSAAVLLQNDRDADMDNLEIVVVDAPTHGTVGRAADGKLVYRPDRNFHGSDQFGYLVTDGHGRSDVVAVIVRVLPTNDDPIVGNDVYATRSGQGIRVNAQNGLLDNDRDVDGDPLRSRLLSGPSNGQVTLEADGSFVYTPANGFSGIDRFRYVALDGNGGRTEGEVVLKVAPVSGNQGPDDRVDGGNNRRPVPPPNSLPVGIPLFRSRR